VIELASDPVKKQVSVAFGLLMLSHLSKIGSLSRMLTLARLLKTS